MFALILSCCYGRGEESSRHNTTSSTRNYNVVRHYGWDRWTDLLGLGLTVILFGLALIPHVSAARPLNVQSYRSLFIFDRPAQATTTTRRTFPEFELILDYYVWITSAFTYTIYWVRTGKPLLVPLY